ncbi:hypothetical protein ACFSNO_31725 [Streptomyces cirratus]
MDDIAVLYDYGRDGGGEPYGAVDLQRVRDGPHRSAEGVGQRLGQRHRQLELGGEQDDRRRLQRRRQGRHRRPVRHGRNRGDGPATAPTKLLTFTSNGRGFNAPVKVCGTARTPRQELELGPRASRSPPTSTRDGKTTSPSSTTTAARADVNRTGLWTFTSTAHGFAGPRLVCGQRARCRQELDWSRSKPTVGDFNLDGPPRHHRPVRQRQDGRREPHDAVGVHRQRHTGFDSPTQLWTSGRESWSWSASKPLSGDFDNDGTTDVAGACTTWAAP